MNKYQKAESRRIKAFVQYFKACGYPCSYRRVRRNIRKWDRAFRDLPKIIPRSIRRGLRRVEYGVSEATKRIGQLGTQASIYLIDETPIEETQAMWTKESLFVTRHLGKWDIAKEDSEE